MLLRGSNKSHGVVSLNRSLAAKAHIRKRGWTGAGNPLWSEREDRIAAVCYPDYARMQRRLPHRSISALVHRCGKLGLTHPAQSWTGNEISRLRKLWPNSTTKKVQASFPNRSIAALQAKAAELGLVRPKTIALTGSTLLDAVRHRAHQMRLSMADLDAMARTGHYFQRTCLKGHAPNLAHVEKAVKILGGEIGVNWREMR